MDIARSVLRSSIRVSARYFNHVFDSSTGRPTTFQGFVIQADRLDDAWEDDRIRNWQLERRVLRLSRCLKR